MAAFDSEDEENRAPEDSRKPEDEASPPKGWRRVRRALLRAFIIAGFLLILVVGLCVLLYPAISDYVNTKNQSRVIDGYKSALRELAPADYSAQLEAAREYNRKLALSASPLHDAFRADENDEETDSDRDNEYKSLLNIAGNGVMGYIDIESLKIELPVYHGTSQSVLAKGAGHLMGTSLPVDGESVHSVVSAHTGLPSAKLFTGIDRLREGDTFTLHVLNETYTYEVDDIDTVLPHEVDKLGIETGAEYITLMTCTPYGINTHRLLIRGHRIENPPDTPEFIAEPENEIPEIELTWFQRTRKAIVEFFAKVIEAVAAWLVKVIEFFMDKFGIEH